MPPTTKRKKPEQYFYPTINTIDMALPESPAEHITLQRTPSSDFYLFMVNVPEPFFEEDILNSYNGQRLSSVPQTIAPDLSDDFASIAATENSSAPTITLERRSSSPALVVGNPVLRQASTSSDQYWSHFQEFSQIPPTPLVACDTLMVHNPVSRQASTSSDQYWSHFQEFSQIPPTPLVACNTLTVRNPLSRQASTLSDLYWQGFPEFSQIPPTPLIVCNGAPALSNSASEGIYWSKFEDDRDLFSIRDLCDTPGPSEDSEEVKADMFRTFCCSPSRSPRQLEALPSREWSRIEVFMWLNLYLAFLHELKLTASYVVEDQGPAIKNYVQAVFEVGVPPDIDLVMNATEPDDRDFVPQFLLRLPSRLTARLDKPEVQVALGPVRVEDTRVWLQDVRWLAYRARLWLDRQASHGGGTLVNDNGSANSI